MEENNKLLLSKWLIFISVLIAMSIALYDEVLTELYPALPAIDINSVLLTVVGLCISAFFVVGLFLGSRGLGQPLSFRIFIKLLFSYPTKLILIPYLLLYVLIIVYFEFKY